jgi:replicative DNA helicase
METFNYLESLECTERALLSCILIAPHLMVDTVSEIRAEMFSTPRYGFAFEAMTQLYRHGEQLDLITLNNEMRIINEAHWRATGGAKPLHEALTQNLSLEAFPQYVREVKRCYLLRALHALFTTQQGKASCVESDYEALITETENALLSLRTDGITIAPYQPIAIVAQQVLAVHRQQYETGKNLLRIPSGIAELDDLMGGLHCGELTVVGGRPSDGKSSVAMHIAIEVASAGYSVCFNSLEMTQMQTMNRYFIGYASVSADRIRKGGVTAEELTQMEQLAEELAPTPLFFNHSPSNSVDKIRAQVMQQCRKGQCQLLIVDYLQLLQRELGRNETMDIVVGRITSVLKRIAEEANIPVILISQLNRNSENRHGNGQQPEIHDLRDSGNIEQVADNIIFVYNPMRHGITHDKESGFSYRNAGILCVKKCRNGSTGTARFKRNESFTRLYDIEQKLKL